MQQPPHILASPVPRLYRLFNICFGVWIAAALLLALFFNRRSLYPFSAGWLVAAMLAGIFFCAALWQMLLRLPVPSKIWRRTVPLALLCLYFAALLMAGWSMRVIPDANWDFGIVYSFAQDYVQNGTLPDDYFLRCANNRGIYLFLCAFFKLLSLFGAREFLLPSLILNALCVTSALWMLHRAAWLLLGERRALFTLLLAFCCPAFILYIPIYYTDTLTLPFVMGAVLLWLHARRCWLCGRKRRAAALFCAASALCALGGGIKITVLILWVAFSIDLVLLWRGKDRFLLLMAGGGITMVILGGFQLLFIALPILPDYGTAPGMPLTLWVWMSLYGDGGYYDPVFAPALALPDYAARKAFIWQEIFARIGEMGPFGLISHLAKKVSFTLGDGTYWAPVKLARSGMQDSPLHRWVLPASPGFGGFAYACFGLHAGMLFWLAAGAFRAARRQTEMFTVLRLAIFGLLAFLLIWETRSRYIVNFLPLFILCAAAAASACRRPARSSAAAC